MLHSCHDNGKGREGNKASMARPSQTKLNQAKPCQTKPDKDRLNKTKQTLRTSSKTKQILELFIWLIENGMRTQSKATLILKYISHIMKFCGNCIQNFKVVAEEENVYAKTIELWSKQLKIAEQCCQICPSVNLQLKSRTQLNMIGNTLQLVYISITKDYDC